MKIEWHDKAYHDASNLVEYIYSDNPMAAMMVYDEIDNQIKLLGENPEMGRKGRVSGTRELIINRTPYVVVYAIKAHQILVLRVLHGAQKWPKK